MEKGVQKRRVTSKRRRIRALTKAVAEYLLSDSYLYAPLIDQDPSVSDPDTSLLYDRIRSPPSNAGKGMPVAQQQNLLVK